MEIQAVKRALRDAIRARILPMPPEIRAREERDLVERFPTLPGFGDAGTVLLYASAFAEEFDTGPMLRLAIDWGKRLICPRVAREENRLALHEIRSVADDFRPGVRGIPEPDRSMPEVDPSAIDWALIPGLGFDPLGYRIGRGAGHYDRLLPRLRPDAPRWALCLSTQWVDALPVESHDRRLDGVADADRVIIITRP